MAKDTPAPLFPRCAAQSFIYHAFLSVEKTVASQSLFIEGNFLFGLACKPASLNEFGFIECLLLRAKDG